MDSFSYGDSPAAPRRARKMKAFMVAHQVWMRIGGEGLSSPIYTSRLVIAAMATGAGHVISQATHKPPFRIQFCITLKITQH